MTKSSRVRRTVIEQSTVAVKQCVCVLTTLPDRFQISGTPTRDLLRFIFRCDMSFRLSSARAQCNALIS